MKFGLCAEEQARVSLSADFNLVPKVRLLYSRAHHIASANTLRESKRTRRGGSL
jgi:hypothetical protein